MERRKDDDELASGHELGGRRMLATTVPDTRSHMRDFPGLPETPLEASRMRSAVASALFGAAPPESPRVGRYSLLKCLGQGGMGVVYSAYDEDLDRRVALKLVREDVIDPEYGKVRLTREAKALAKLSHANVVSVYEVGTHEGRLFLAMEYVNGRTLRDWLHETPRSVSEIVGVFAAAGRGLAAAHEAGLVHRDFKPDNVLLDQRDWVRVVDFGLARPTRNGGDDAPVRPDQQLPLDELTRTGALLGTPAYMAPEQLKDGGADARSDQFSFCISLYEAVYGRRPFAGRTAEELRKAVEMGPSLSPGGKATAALRAVLARGLAADPRDRFESMSALLTVLVPSPPRRRPLLILATAAGALLLGGGAALGFQSGAQLEACPDAQAEAERIWSPARRAALPDARMRLLVTERVDRWVDSQRVACEGEGLSTEEAAARRRCAADHLRELDATVKYVEANPLDAMTLEHVLWETGDPRRCADGRAQHLPAELDDAGLGERVAIRFGLGTAVLEAARGRLGGALHRAQELLEDAHSLGGSVEAEVMLGVAQIHDMAGEHLQATALFKDAAVAARRAGDPVREGAALGYAAGNVAAFGPLEEAAELAAQARAVRDSLGADPRVDAYLAHADAILHALRKSGDAVPGMERAYDASRAGLSPYHLNQVATANNLGVVYRESGQKEKALEAWEAGLAMAERLDPEGPQVLYPLYNMSDLYVEMGEREKAVAAARRALAVARKASLPDSDNVYRALNHLAEALAFAGDWAELAVVLEEVVEVTAPRREKMPVVYAAGVLDLQIARSLADGTPLDEEALRLARTTLEANRPLPSLHSGDVYWVVVITLAQARHEAGQADAAKMAREAVAGMEALTGDRDVILSPTRGAAALILADSDHTEALRLAKLSLADPEPHSSPLLQAAALEIRRRVQAWVDSRSPR